MQKAATTSHMALICSPRCSAIVLTAKAPARATPAHRANWEILFMTRLHCGQSGDRLASGEFAEVSHVESAYLRYRLKKRFNGNLGIQPARAGFEHSHWEQALSAGQN